MLPQLCPYARIMAFGYESQWFGEYAIRQTLSPVAKSLLFSKDRPLIMIGHCYGGLVIQKMLITAKLHSEDWPGLYSSTSGIVFLRTPHTVVQVH